MVGCGAECLAGGRQYRNGNAPPLGILYRCAWSRPALHAPWLPALSRIPVCHSAPRLLATAHPHTPHPVALASMPAAVPAVREALQPCRLDGTSLDSVIYRPPYSLPPLGVRFSLGWYLQPPVPSPFCPPAHLLPAVGGAGHRGRLLRRLVRPGLVRPGLRAPPEALEPRGNAPWGLGCRRRLLQPARTRE